MSQDESPMIDLIRWTFTVAPEKRAQVEQLLADYGLEVFARGEEQLVALWDEPEGDLDELVEQVWEVAGSAVEITHEEFRRSELVILHQEDQDGTGIAAA
jgi:hypothetical protein